MIGWTVFLLTVLGTLLCLSFVLMHRPSSYFAPRVVAAIGWEVIAFLVFLRSDFSLGFTHMSAYNMSGWVDFKALFGVSSLVLIDGYMIYKIRLFLKFRNDYEMHLRRLEKESSSE